MRGTDSLLPEQRPSGRKMRGRTQPYRRKQDRPPGSTLDAILRGRPQYLPNPAEMQRQMMAIDQMKRRRGR